MGYRLPNGSIMEIASTYGTQFAVTGITNANPGVVTAPDADVTDGAVIALTSGWTRLNDRAFRADAPTADGFTLEGVDTTGSAYSAGAGVGSGRAVSAWAQISQITDVATSGGEQQFATFGFLEEDEDRQLPTTKSAMSMTLTVADDPTLPYVATCEAADDDREPRVLRLTLPNGSVILYNAYVSISATPSLSRNNIMTRTITLSLAGRPVRYAA
ncbi:phage tail protein [Pseudomonas luteola]|uniref:phage tail protein n=1 Tax=Pseudomonas luteola TaxID=47886 RepID=UPI001238FDA2|nr:phage tail protein [Pseudomonas luteola]QEU28916.1 phage tail protein [Pseudomonas luteola]